MTCADIDYFSRPPKDEADNMNDPETKDLCGIIPCPKDP